MFVDSHSHIYSEEYNTDRDEVIARAVNAGVEKIILPNIDSASIKPMIDLADSAPDLFIPLMGLHPTSVKEDFRKEIEILEYWLGIRRFSGIGEIGIDLYWDKTFIKEQIEVFRIQIGWAKQMNLPIVVHVRDAFPEVIEVLKQTSDSSLKGVLHSFTGTLDQAKQCIELGFNIGIGGIVTFKNSGLDQIVRQIPLDHMLLETDAPWLAPVPHRGKRNESAYITAVAAKVAELHQITIEEVAQITARNAKKLFQF